ncbi:unnamed protein product [Candidula unifasciata]|uniref:Protein arginine methyltransferase NDUFAF7 n=1 Tax=Candidula unifasciata TaxID=100452 RepID=A0A8S3ZGZ3_9EUPU|nr:unnamed protein product [Candidula unifasciata]
MRRTTPVAITTACRTASLVCSKTFHKDYVVRGRAETDANLICRGFHLQPQCRQIHACTYKYERFHAKYNKCSQHTLGRMFSSSNIHCYSTKPADVNPLLKHLQRRIKMAGPITVADYMKEVLTNSVSGYYMNRDVFGAAGDFITSPEISQMFGEVFGVWVVNEWLNHYDNQQIQIVELGPGRGTLADDMLRVFSQFPAIKDKISVHLVEVSPALSRMQAAKVTGRDISDIDDKFVDTAELRAEPYQQLPSKYGPLVSWYRSLADVPHGLSCYVAHEFLDALPIHKFHKTEHGWREVLVDVDAANDSLRFVLAPGPTPASVAYLKSVQSSEKTNVEICPSAGLIVQEICQRIGQHGGLSLLADYGHTGEKGGTFRAFKNHALHDPLVDPGTADLTADVDFSYLKNMVSDNDGVSVFGPITQARFLSNMGIGLRLQTLLQNASQDHWSDLVSGYKMLTSPEQMGERFKFMSILPKLRDAYVPAGFVDLDFNVVSDRQSK